MIWVIWKVRHIIKLLSLANIIYTDYEANVRITKQISLLTMLIKKQNLHLVYVSKYLQCFNLNIHYKLNK